MEEVELLPSAAEAWQGQRTIMDAEVAVNLDREWGRGREGLSPSLRAQIERGRTVTAFDYQRAVARIRPLVASFPELFEQRYDAIVTPAAVGTAPLGLESTGDPIFCSLWTFCGMPAVSLPLLQGSQRSAPGRSARRASSRRRAAAPHRALAGRASRNRLSPGGLRGD